MTLVLNSSSRSVSWDAGTATGASSSSDARVPSLPVYFSAFFSTSFVITSSFFWSSPCTLTSPCKPRSSTCCSGALRTRLAMTFVASRIEFMMRFSSLSTSPRFSSSIMYLANVIPVCSQTSESSSILIPLFAGVARPGAAARRVAQRLAERRLPAAATARTAAAGPKQLGGAAHVPAAAACWPGRWVAQVAAPSAGLAVGATAKANAMAG
mmetsp:Transcript_59504/g.138598  ORF Transcript_59504/g.138598 Transcript_59504/m.138598 type:complete len:211 (+) Transcript_59504:890-1522(+)